MKTCYLFDPITKEFLEQYLAQESPLEAGVFIVTDYHCEDAPPLLGAHQTAVRNAANSAWTVVPDYRNAEVFDANGNVVKVAAIGELPTGLSITKPIPPAPIATLTPRQIRLVLNSAGLRSTVEVAVASASQDVKDMWEFSLEYRRDDATLNQMATSIGISQTQLDQLFTQGALL